MEIIEYLLFSISLIANLVLITVFIVRKKEDYHLVQRIGYFLLIPGALAVIGIIMIINQGLDGRLAWFLGFFLAFLTIELLFDYILKIDFRNNWKPLVPYLILYYMANYSLTMMNWLFSVTRGIIILILFIIQIITNAWSHPKTKII